MVAGPRNRPTHNAEPKCRVQLFGPTSVQFKGVIARPFRL